VDSPRRRLDPLALAVIGAAVAFVVVASAYVLVSVRKESAPPPTDVRKTVEDLVASLRSRIEPKPPTPPAAKPSPQPLAKAPAKAPAKPAVKVAPPPPTGDRPIPARVIAEHGAGRTWHYRVSVEPAVWRDATLTYRLIGRDSALQVDTHFRHAGGKMDFHLGTFAAGHPSHANTRFPGFFMHAAYLDRPLDVGTTFTWEWPWREPGGPVRAGRVKRWEGAVMEWENLPAPPSAKAPSDIFRVARIEAVLSYIEDGRVQAMAAETLWYAPRFMQVVKVVREGKTPDEAAHRIVAELVEHRYP